MWTILTTKTFDKNFKKLDSKVSSKIVQFVSDLESDPVPKGWNIKKMIGFENEYRCRIGTYRVLYKVIKKEIVIVMIDVDHRKDIYK
mgnify:CR=1 FL=1